MAQEKKKKREIKGIRYLLEIQIFIIFTSKYCEKFDSVLAKINSKIKGYLI